MHKVIGGSQTCICKKNNVKVLAASVNMAKQTYDNNLITSFCPASYFYVQESNT